MRNNKFLATLLACSALAVAPVAQSAVIPTIIGQNTGTGTNSVSTTTTAAVSLGDHVYLSTFTGNGTNPSAVTGLSFAGCVVWTARSANGATGSIIIGSYDCVVTTAEPIGTTIAVTWTGTAGSRGFIAYDAVTGILDQSASAGFTTSTAPSYTTPSLAANDLVYTTIVTSANPSSLTPQADTTCNTVFSGLFFSCYSNPPSAGAYTNTSTLGTSRAWGVTGDAYLTSAAATCGTRRSLTGVGC